ncbi:hypothetical protein LguiB_020872 [Lonicera macranthoides]
MDEYYYMLRDRTVKVKISEDEIYCLGGGAMVHESGLVLVSYNLIADEMLAARLQIRNPNPKFLCILMEAQEQGGYTEREYDAQIFDTQPSCNLALLKICAPRNNFPVVNFPDGDGDGDEEGDELEGEVDSRLIGMKIASIVTSDQSSFNFRIGRISYPAGKRTAGELKAADVFVTPWTSLDLSLIEMSNIHGVEVSATGSPIFSMKGEMVGLLIFSANFLDYAVSWEKCKQFVREGVSKLQKRNKRVLKRKPTWAPKRMAAGRYLLDNFLHKRCR